MTINGLQVVGDFFAYDGCHKIYVLETELEKKEALDNEYAILPIQEIEKAFTNSCGLKFINNWSFSVTYVEQGEDASFENEN